MKKNLLNILVLFLLLPVMLFPACKSSNLKAINLPKYLKNEISVTKYGIIDSNGALEENNDYLALLTQTKAKPENLSKYLKFQINAIPNWMYKMYVDYISFNIYCNESAEQMTINITMTNLASEEEIISAVSESVKTETISEQLAIAPKAKKVIKCKIPIKKTVATSLGSTITIDALNSPELFSNDSTFTWLIYGFEIHGESRAYSKQSN